MADFEKVYRVDLDTSKADKSIQRFIKRVQSLEKRIVKAFSNKKIQSALTRFSTKLDASVGSFNRVRLAANSAGRSIGRAADKGFSRMDMLNKNLRKVERETKRVGKEVARFLGPQVRRGADGAGKSLDKMGRRGRSATEKIAFGARRAERGLRRIGIASNFATVSMGALAAKISLLIGAAAGVRSITRNFLDFDATMTRAGAKFSGLDKTMQPGTKAFKNFRNEIRAASRDVEHSAASVAAAVDFWAKAGKSAEQTKAVIPLTLDFASANTDAAGAALEMARAGDILSDALGQFRLDSADPTTLMKNTARISDVMSAAANSANVSAEELFESFKQAGPVLSSVGGDIEETSALLATMANAGIKGSIAGRQLKIAVAALNAPTAKQQALLEDYGVAIKDAEGNFRGLTTIVGDLDRATKDLGTGARFEVLGTLLGRQGITGF